MLKREGSPNPVQGLCSGFEEVLFSSPLHSPTSLASCQSHRIWEALLEAGTTNTYNSRIWKVEARGLGVWDHVWLHEVLSPARPQTLIYSCPSLGKTVCVRYTSWGCAASGWDLCQVFPGFWPLIQKSKLRPHMNLQGLEQNNSVDYGRIHCQRVTAGWVSWGTQGPKARVSRYLKKQRMGYWMQSLRSSIFKKF